MQLSDRTVVIIGGSSGIGFATAQRAIAQGAKVIITGRSAAKLQQAAHALGGAQTACVDVSDPATLPPLFDGIEQVNHLVVLGGSLSSGMIRDTPLEQLGAPLVERVWGAIHTIRAALPKMTTGSITLTSGLFSTRPIAGMSVVAAAVGGIEAMTQALSLELAPIRVNAIAPGYIDTPLLQAAFADQYEGVVKAQAATLPVQRIGSAHDTAEAIVMLMTNEFITGEVLHIDGGGRFV